MKMADEPILEEYFKLVDLITEFDKRLLTVKSWGVTLSLASLGLGFQHKHWGFFLLAAISSLTFWIIEGTMKSHQMRFYPRMREIEVERDKICQKSNEIKWPRIDYTWENAEKLLSGNIKEIGPVILRGESVDYKMRYLSPSVCLPHIGTFVTGIFLFLSSVLNLFTIY
jgi:hypothetical protein